MHHPATSPVVLVPSLVMRNRAHALVHQLDALRTALARRPRPDMAAALDAQFNPRHGVYAGAVALASHLLHALPHRPLARPPVPVAAQDFASFMAAEHALFGLLAQIG